MTGIGREACRKSRSGQKALVDVWEWSGNPPGYPGGPLECPRVVGRPSRMSGSGRQALINDWVFLGGSTGCPGVVERLSRMSGSGQETLPDVQVWSEALPVVRGW